MYASNHKKLVPSIGRLSLTVSFILIILLQVHGQRLASAHNFDIQDFNKKFETAQWLVEYDEVAWKTSDVVMTEDKGELAKLGAEWFCLQDKNKVWHAVYGKL